MFEIHSFFLGVSVGMFVTALACCLLKARAQCRTVYEDTAAHRHESVTCTICSGSAQVGRECPGCGYVNRSRSFAMRDDEEEWS